MSRRFLTLLERAARIRQMIEREQRLPAPNAVRLIRMKRLDLSLANTLRTLTAKKILAMASAPRFTPRLVFDSGRLAPARW